MFMKRTAGFLFVLLFELLFELSVRPFGRTLFLNFYCILTKHKIAPLPDLKEHCARKDKMVYYIYNKQRFFNNWDV